MESTFLFGYTILNIVMIGLSLLVAYKAYMQKKESGTWLCITGLAAIWIMIMYYISVVTPSRFVASMTSSLCFIGFDWVVMFLLHFVLVYTGYEKYIANSFLKKLGIAYACFETLIFLINPFKEIAVGYIYRETYLAKYAYDKFLLYNFHLAFTYLISACILVVLIIKMLKTPVPYKRQYAYDVLIFILVLVINAVFLFIRSDSLFSLIDFSTLLYSVALCLLYWTCFNYTKHEMLKNLTLTIFDNIDQGIVLFDYEGKLVQKNARAEQLLHMKLENEMPYVPFLEVCNISQNILFNKNMTSLQCFRECDGKSYPLRCDFRRMDNRYGKEVGFLYVFTDAELETDIMTGFQNMESFRRYLNTHLELSDLRVGVAVFDINNLEFINSSMGKTQGDKKVRELADAIRNCYPEDSFFVRGRDAHLYAVSIGVGETAMDTYAKAVVENYDGHIQYAVAIAEAGQTDVSGAMKRARKSMRNKKLLDKESAHSQALSSLVQALRQSDVETEVHVQRTQQMGYELGKRLKLTDIEMSNLSLLCLLHDIGKIGIPVDILNKPGKLSKEEWSVLQTHVYKGYQIALSSTELKDIAEMILRHHERWDGQGYPDGLSRETIPLLSRIIAVVDAYDAMIYDRPYRKAFTIRQAIDELRRCAGSQFDPHIVAEFIDLLKENREFTRGQLIEESIPASLSDEEPKRSVEPQIENAKAGTHAASAYTIVYSKYLLDKNNYIIRVDDNFKLLTGYDQDDVLNMNMRQEQLIPENGRMEYLVLISELLAQSSFVFLEHPLLKKDGSQTYVLCYGKVYYDSAVQEYRSEIVIADTADTHSVKTLMETVNDRARGQLEEWEKTFRKDSLTGLFNHNAFQNDVEMKLLEQNSRIVLLMMDVDKFKDYNDTYGHSAGDDFLIYVAHSLKSALRKDDLACRMGGDEFSAALSFDLSLPEEDIKKRIRQIFDKLSFAILNKSEGTSLSMGVAMASEGETFNSIYKRADQALYHSKEEGRARISFSDELQRNEN